ncbi:small integral membrane protein 14 [Bacillus rossius redtenbacheri]|uniref:small integral membrane protein 14 n=1 Tax=Bacillus rossius redtenbacheri TaxID=93214 RepID=UPI002FDE0454
MSDEDFDLCQCEHITHLRAMQRLLSLLRQSQGYCTDTECVDLVRPGELPSAEGDSPSGFVMLAMCWFALALFLFFARPRSLRATGTDDKPRDNGQGPQGSPPAIN